MSQFDFRSYVPLTRRFDFGPRLTTGTFRGCEVGTVPTEYLKRIVANNPGRSDLTIIKDELSKRIAARTTDGD